MYFVDTPVWIDFLRGRKVAHVAALTELLQGEETVGIAPIILQEILQGANSDRRLDPRSSNDCLIGMIAVEHDLVLLHNDPDFEVIAAAEPALRLYRL